MINKPKTLRSALRRGAALQAIVLLGAGVGTSAALIAPAAAQDYTTGALVGTVVDTAGARVSGGTATVTSVAQGFSRDVTIASDGSFRVAALPVGTYKVTVSASGQSPVDTTVAIAAGTNNTYTFTVGGTDTADAGTGGDIVVTGRAVRGNDFGTTTGGLTLSNVQQTLDTLPIQKNLTTLILLAPGTTAGDTTFGNLPSISGATVAENVYYVNGLNTTNFRNFVGSTEPPQEFYQSLDVKTFGIPAEYGRALGGFTSAVTKSGSNQFKAGAVVTFAPDALRDDSPDTYASYNRNDYVQSVDANFYLSGPLIKDHLFFYGLYNPGYSKTEDSSLLSNQRVTTTNGSPFFGAKIDAIIVDGQRIEGTFFRNKTKVISDYVAFNSVTKGIGAPLGSTIQEYGGNQFVVTYNGQFTNWFNLSASYGENHDNQSFTPSPNLSLTQSTLNGTTQTANGFTTSLTRDQDTRKFIRADADLYVNLLGSHHFRGGYERETLTSFTDTRYSGSGYRYLLTAAGVRQYYYLNTGTFKSRNEAFYLQDSWSLFNDRINLQLGVRNDRFNSDSISGEKYFTSGNQWAPRLGVSFDVFGDKKTTLRAYYGRYFLPVATNTNIRLGGAELYYSQTRAYLPGVNTSIVDANGNPFGLTYDENGVPGYGGVISTGNPCPDVSPNAGEPCRAITSDGVAGPTDTLVSSTLQPSYTDEIAVGAQHRIGDWTFGLTWVHRVLGRTLDDVAIDAAVLKYCDANGVAGCADVWSGFHQYVLANPGSDITVRLDGDCTVAGQCDVATLKAADLGYPRAKRYYDSVQFDFNKVYSNRWSLGGSYSWTKLRGNYEGAVKSDNGQDDAGLTQDFDQPGLLDGAYGDLANGRRHSFKLFGTYGFTDSLRIGFFGLLESPRKFSCIGYYPDGNNFAAAYQNASYYCAQPRFSGNPSFPNTNGATNPDGSAVTTSYLVPRGTAFKSQWNKNINLNLQYALASLPGSYFSVDVFNVFNFKSKLDYQEFGDNADGSINAQYGQVIGYQAPRSVRFTFAMRFGESPRN